MKLLNVLLCLVCAAAVAVFWTTTRANDNVQEVHDVVSYIGVVNDDSAEKFLAETSGPANESGLVRGLGFRETAGLAATRWHDRLDSARAANAAPTTKARMGNPSKAAAYPHKKPFWKAKNDRRRRTIFEQTRHYDRYRYQYETTYGGSRFNPRTRTRTGAYRVPRPKSRRR